ncbi:hypothetical protein [Pelagibacterium lacus]|uniref:Tail tape measure protein n=1 Tax=Pelagibacterium lacus TaxID=2282655 RepID=A0A369W014_9HYPH|nr:hypothetical protein [Pelagibacterium lacus]RDE07898.1 hypothetical protein DVH29_14195 [Pelagibacterium lacus]
MELENAAIEAGLALTPQRRAEIEKLADSYALAAANAEAMAQAQQLADQAFDDLAQAGRQALDTIIDGFIEGKNAGEIFNSVLKDLAKNLINIGLNLVSGGLSTGGGGLLGGILIPGILHGGGVAGSDGYGHGRAFPASTWGGAQRYHRGGIAGLGPNEVPAILERGEIVLPKGASGQPMSLTVHIVSDDEKFSAYVEDKAGRVVARSAPTIIGASVGQANKSAPAAVATYQRHRAGSDYRQM